MCDRPRGPDRGGGYPSDPEPVEELPAPPPGPAPGTPTGQPVGHDLSMPHEYRGTDTEPACPPNCPRRRWRESVSAAGPLAALAELDRHQTSTAGRCVECGQPGPCDARIAADVVRVLVAERDALASDVDQSTHRFQALTFNDEDVSDWCAVLLPTDGAGPPAGICGELAHHRVHQTSARVLAAVRREF